MLGVDADPVAIGAAQRNAAALEPFRMLRFVRHGGAGDGAIFIKGRLSTADRRSSIRRAVGARHLMSTIVRMRASRVLYVSCDVATLARDLRILIQGGYAVSSVKAFDFFPNTHHCEVLALLT